MNTLTDTAGTHNTAAKMLFARPKTGFVSIAAAATLALVFVQPSAAVTAAAVFCLSFAMIALSLNALNEGQTDNSRRAITLISPLFAGAAVWLAILAGQAVGGGVASVLTTAFVLPAIIFCEGLVSLFLIGTLSRKSARPVDTAAALLVADKYSGFAGTLRKGRNVMDHTIY